MKFIKNLLKEKPGKINANLSTPVSHNDWHHKQPRRTMMALEPRIMFDGAAVETAVDTVTDPGSLVQDNAIVDQDAAKLAQALADYVPPAAEAKTVDSDLSETKSADYQPLTTDISSTADVHQVVVVDWTVADYQTLIAGMDPSMPVIVLQPGHSGLSGLADALSAYKNLDAVHLVTEGHGGAIQLGLHWIDDAAVNADPSDIQAIGNALKPGGDLMLYGCSAAYGEAGQKFVDDLARSLGDVDVAASTDRTGPTQLGGDWDLEYATGTIDTVLPFTLQGMQDISHCLGCTMSSNNIIGGDGSTVVGHYVAFTGYYADVAPYVGQSAFTLASGTSGGNNFEDKFPTLCSSGPTNTAPTFTATGATPTYTEDGSAVSLFSSTSADTKDTGRLSRN